MKTATKNIKTSAPSMRRLLPVCLLLLCAATAALAQGGRGSISGLVSDPSGALVAGAKITLLDHATGVAQHTASTGAGLYSFVSLNPGVYKVTASMQGFENTAVDNVNVTVDQVSTVNIALTVGSVTNTVTVSGSVDLVENSNSTVGQLISAETIDRVPLLARNVFDLAQLSAGVTPANGSPNSSGSQAIESITSGRPGVDVSSYTINGSLVGSVYYMVDGSPLGIAENNVAAIIPAMEIPEDGVEETRVETQNTPASYQSGGAGVISVVSKSGGDKFHGDVFGVFRPDALAANEWFNKQTGNSTPGYHRYQEGGAISGPILHEKLFFFGDYEATQQAAFDGSNIYTVPTAAERTGDFSADAANFTIYDPTQVDNPDGTRQAFANNTITNPNPIALNFLSEFPLPNRPGSSANQNAGNRYDPGLDPSTAQRFDIRMDYYMSEKQRIFGRFSFDRLFEALVNTSKPPSGAYSSVPMWDPFYAQNITNARNFMLADDYTLNSSTVIQLRYSFTRHYEVQGGDPAQAGYDITKLGFPAALKAVQAHAYSLPFVIFNSTGSAIGGTANYNNFLYASENSDVNGNVTKLWGKQEFSFGAEFMKRLLNAFQPPNPAGVYGFDASATDQQTSAAVPVGGNDFASALVGLGFQNEGGLGYAGNFSQDLAVAEASPYYAAFFEDTYRPNKALTVTLGLRWDIFGGKTERHNRLESFVPKAAGSASGVSYTGAEEFVSSGSRTPFTTNLGDLAPRLGISWQPESHLVIRGGGGFYYGASAHMVGGAALDSDGFASGTNWNAACLNADGNTVFNGSAACGGSGASGAGNYTGAYSLSNPFPSGLVPLINNPAGLGNDLGITLNTMMHSQRTLTTYNFNFGLEYELPRGFVLSAGYVGSRGLFLPIGNVDLNTLDLGTIGKYQGELCAYGEANCQMVANTWENIQPSTNSNFGQGQVPLWVSLQQYPQFGGGSYGAGNGVNVHGYPSGDSEYSSLQTKVQKRLTAHFTTLASFTWAKLMTDDGNPPLGFVGSHGGGAQDTKNLSFEHAVSPQDVKYQFTWQASYDLPMGKGRALNLSGVGNAVLGGWTVDGILYASTGIPIPSPAAGTPNAYFNQRSDITCDPSKGAPHTQAAWFNDACFAIPGSQYVAGTAPAYLDHLRTMGAEDLDATVSKNFKFGETRNLRIDVSSYNIANRAQFGMPYVTDITSVLAGQGNPFGQITTTINTPRQFQFGSRFTF
jgi:hypothetical protein